MKLKANQLILLAGMAAASLLSGCVNFDLTSAPKANVYEYGEIIAETPYKFTLNHGERDFIIQKDGYVQHDLTVSSLDRAKIHVKLEKIDKTPLITKPTSATIVDAKTGKDLGLTPTEFKLDRPLTVLLQKEGYETEEVKLIPNRRHRIDMRPIEGWQPIMATSISVNSTPTGAKVIDRVTEHVLGTTPFKQTIDFGTEIQFVKEGFLSESVRVTKNTPKKLSVKLSPLPKVTINSEPGAEIFYEGSNEKLGTVPYTTDVQSPMFLEIRKEGYYPETIRVTPKTIRNLDVPLTAIAYITLETQPAGATLYRIGGLEKLGTTPHKALYKYERQFEIRHPGYHSKVIAIGPDSPKKLEVLLAPMEQEHSDAAAVSDSLIDENAPRF